MTFDPVVLNTTTPVDVKAALTLGVGRNYGAQYQGPGTLALRESDETTTPDLDQAYSRATAQDALRLTPKANEGIWCVVAGVPALQADGAQIVVWEE